MKKVEDYLDHLEYVNQHDMPESRELFRLLPVIDAFLVRHGRTDLARQLRRAFDKYVGL